MARLLLSALVVALTVPSLAACGEAGEEPVAAGGEKLRVVATTSIVADVVARVGGDTIELSVLLPPGVDPHSFKASPQDLVAVTQAGLIVANGAGLETFLEPLLESARAEAETVLASEGVDLIALPAAHDEHPEQGWEAATGLGEGVDPHVWTDPNNVVVWTENIEKALRRLDPANADDYSIRAEAYRHELWILDAWIREQVEQVPEGNRLLVMDHLVFGYFARRYGFEQLGALLPGFTTVAQPSAQQLAALEDRVQEYGVRALFVGSTVNPALAQQVADDTGIQLVPVYTGSLSAPGGDADTYLDYVKHNVFAIVEALK